MESGMTTTTHPTVAQPERERWLSQPETSGSNPGKYALPAHDLPRSFKGLLDGTDILQEAEPCDLRYVGVLGLVGLIFDLRTALYASADWAAPADVAVLIVGSVEQCSVPWLRDQLESWHVSKGLGSWSCSIGCVHGSGKIRIAGGYASVYGGVVPGLPDRQPHLGTEARNKIRSGWPTRQSEFVLTAEPEHSDPQIPLLGC